MYVSLTLAPAFRNLSAKPLPNPEPAPVINAAAPLTSIFDVYLIDYLDFH